MNRRRAVVARVAPLLTGADAPLRADRNGDSRAITGEVCDSSIRALPDLDDPWMHAMRLGRFEDAWEISDRILRGRAGVPCWHLPRHEQYIWAGQPLAGKRVLIRCYHGLGDTVQFIRFAAPLKAIARETVVWAQPELIPLLRTAEGIDRLLPLHDGSPECDYDVDIELMELPHAFRTTLQTLPNRVPYLHDDRACSPGASADVDGMPTPHNRANPAGAFRVGIVWQSGGWDDRRSIPTALLEPLTSIPGVCLVALQQGEALAEWPRAWGNVESTPDVLLLARRLRALDLMITVDSFPAHLAGALAVPTWTLLHAGPDWRWMLGREDSPWYPTMRLWRQPTPGDWSAVIGRIANELRRVAAPNA